MVKQKENSEFKVVKPCLRIDLVSHLAWMKRLGIYIYIYIYSIYVYMCVCVCDLTMCLYVCAFMTFVSCATKSPILFFHIFLLLITMSVPFASFLSFINAFDEAFHKSSAHGRVSQVTQFTDQFIISHPGHIHSRTHALSFVSSYNALFFSLFCFILILFIIYLFLFSVIFVTLFRSRVSSVVSA